MFQTFGKVMDAWFPPEYTRFFRDWRKWPAPRSRRHGITPRPVLISVFAICIIQIYMSNADTTTLQKGSLEMILLALLDARPRHGYELAKLIESESGNKLQFHVASLYPMLYRLERRGMVEGRWVEKAGERRRRFYRLTPQGRRALAQQRRNWREFANALNRLTGFNHA